MLSIIKSDTNIPSLLKKDRGLAMPALSIANKLVPICPFIRDFDYPIPPPPPPPPNLAIQSNHPYYNFELPGFEKEFCTCNYINPLPNYR